MADTPLWALFALPTPTTLAITRETSAGAIALQAVLLGSSSYFDPAKETGGDLARALTQAKAGFFVCSFKSDWRFPPARSREMVRALVASRKAVTYAEIDAQHGHDAFLLDNPHYHQLIAAYVDNIAVEIGAGARRTPLALAATELEEMKAYAGGRSGT